MVEGRKEGKWPSAPPWDSVLEATHHESRAGEEGTLGWGRQVQEGPESCLGGHHTLTALRACELSCWPLSGRQTKVEPHRTP